MFYKNKVIKNASWIIACKIIQSLITLIVGMMTARYLGPSDYGTLNYISSIIAFVLPIMQLGLNQTLVREIIANPEKEGAVLGTATLLNILSGFLCIVCVNLCICTINKNEQETILVCFIYSFVMLFQATEMIQYWFQAKLLSKYPSIAMLIAYFIVAIYKSLLLFTGKSISWFAASNVLEHFIISIILILLYFRCGGQQFCFQWKLGKELLLRSKYYILPGIMVRMFQHTDKIMLKMIQGEEETGIYSAAITCIGVTAFVFSAVLDSARPVILEAKDESISKFEKRVVQLYCIIIGISLIQSITMTLFAKPMVLLLYGEGYVNTINVLRIAVWYITFSYCGSVRNIWILAENKQKYLLGINCTGALLNVALNFMMIPHLGAVGAAIASLFSQFVTNIVLGFIIKPIRRNNYLMLQSLNPNNIIKWKNN